MPSGVIISEALTDALTVVTGGAFRGPSRPTVGGFSNLSFHTTMAAEPVVVKAATLSSKRADLRREATVLSLLDQPGDTVLPVAEVRWHGDYEDWTVTVMKFVPGIHGIEEVERSRDTRDAAARVRGTLLARLLHAVQRAAPQPVQDPDLDLSRRIVALRSFVDAMPAVDDDTLGAMQSALGSRSVQRGVSFVHGDFGLHNLLWQVAESPSRMRVGALLDWEFAGWGSPLTDVAWLWWTLQFRGTTEIVWPHFVEAFGPWALETMGFSSEAVRDVISVQMIQLLSRTEAGSASRTEWLKRWRALATLPEPTLLTPPRGSL